MAMVFNPNSFRQPREKGQYEECSGVVNVKVDATQTTPVIAGDGLKIVSTAGNSLPHVVKCADTDAPHGFVIGAAMDGGYSAGAVLQMCSFIRGFLTCEAAGAIPAGSKVEKVTDAQGITRVQVLDKGKEIGWAYEPALALGDLLRIAITVPK